MMRRKRRKGGRQSGFSLVEVMVVVALLALVLGSVAIVGSASDKAYQTGTIESHLESKVAIAMDRMVDELVAEAENKQNK